VWNSTKCLETQKNNLKGSYNFKYPLSYLSFLPETLSPVIQGNRTNFCVTGNPIACFNKFPSPIYNPLTPHSLHLIQLGIIKYSSFANILKLRIKLMNFAFCPYRKSKGVSCPQLTSKVSKVKVRVSSVLILGVIIKP